MDLDAFLADSVVSAEGKLFVQGGGWNVINVPQFPYVLPRCGIALILRIPYTATNQTHRFEVSLRDEDGAELPLGDAPPELNTPDGKVHRLGGELNVGRPPTIQPGDEQIVALAINIDGLPFNGPGRYSFVVELDGTEVRQLSFRAIQVPQMAPVLR